jgi:hypothetical protein
LRFDTKNNELVVGQLPNGKNVSKETQDIIGMRYQTATGEDSAD